MQALSVVDWCRAKVEDCRFEHTGNALWFGNRVINRFNFSFLSMPARILICTYNICVHLMYA